MEGYGGGFVVAGCAFVCHSYNDNHRRNGRLVFGCLFRFWNYDSTSERMLTLFIAMTSLNCTSPMLICFDPLLEFTYHFRWLRLSSLFHWATHLVFVTQLTWRSIAYPPLLRMLFLFGWPPCQRSDMTLVEVSQHAYDNSYIRTILSFVFF